MIGKRGKKKLDPKGKHWFAFYSVNGTMQHHRKLSWKQARDFAREHGYIGRFETTEPPVKKKKKKITHRNAETGMPVAAPAKKKTATKRKPAKSK